MDKKSPDAFRTISEVADWLGVQAHVLRFWESKFPQVKPVKRAGGRRYYRPADMELIGGIKTLLHDQGMTIKGVQKILKEEGVAHVSSFSPSPDEMPADGDELGRNVVKFQGREAEEAADAAPDQSPVPAENPPEDDGPLFRAAGNAQDADAAAPDPQPPEEDAAQDTAAKSTPGPDGPAEDSNAPTVPAPIPRLVEAADPPPLDQIAVSPGALSLVAGVLHLDAETTTRIVPLVARLAALRDRMSASDKSV